MRRVSYGERFQDALHWSKQYRISPSCEDIFSICLILVDVQNTLCLPDFELFVAGRSGTGAIDDNRRLCEFIYRNLHLLKQISPTLDTHQAMQIFHRIFLVDEDGQHPSPYTLVSEDDIKNDLWKIHPTILASLQIESTYAQAYLDYCVHQLQKSEKFDLTI